MFTQNEIIKSAKSIGLSAKASSGQSFFITPDGTKYKLTDEPLIPVPGGDK